MLGFLTILEKFKLEECQNNLSQLIIFAFDSILKIENKMI